MPADFLINTEHKVVFSYGWGSLTFDDIKSHRTRLWQHAKFSPDLKQIALLSDVADMNLSSDEIRSLAREPVFAPHSPRALVAAPSLHFGLSRMFNAYSQAQVIRVFRSVEEAVAWMNVPIELTIRAFDDIRHANKLV